MKRAIGQTLLAALLAVGAVAARAEVFEIGGDGTMHSRTAGGGPDRYEDSNSGTPDDVNLAEPGVDVPSGALTLLSAPEAPAAFQGALQDAAQQYAVSPSLLAALVWHESRWQPAAVSNKGAIGLGQLMPATARALAVDPRDARANLAGAAHYLRNMLDLFDGDVERALAAYNAGPGRVLKANGVPAIAETRTYVANIIDRLAITRPDLANGGTR